MLHTYCRMQLHVPCNLSYATTQVCSCMCRMQLNFSCIRQLQNPKFLVVSIRYPTIISIIYQREKVQYFSNKNVITLVWAKKGYKVDWAQIIFNSLCSELDRWYKYVKENKKNTCQYALVLTKIFQYLFVHQKDNP